MELPLKIVKNLDAMDNLRVYIVDANDNRVCCMYDKDFNEYCSPMPDAQMIIEAVNNYKKEI